MKLLTDDQINDIKAIPLKDSNLIGQGSFGNIYQILYNGKSYVLKEIPNILKTNCEKTTCDKEADILQRLSENKGAKDYVPKYYGKYKHGDNCYIIMEYINGVDLERLYRDNYLTTELIEYILDEIPKALETFHALGVIHDDIFLDNIMLEFKDNEPKGIKIIDFGVAGFIGEPHYAKPGIPRTPKSNLECYEKIKNTFSRRIKGGYSTKQRNKYRRKTRKTTAKRK